MSKGSILSFIINISYKILVLTMLFLSKTESEQIRSNLITQQFLNFI